MSDTGKNPFELMMQQAQEMARAFKFFVGGRLGNGRQWVSWIHLDDAVAAYRFASERDGLSGPVNLVAPGPVRNREFAKAMGRALHRPSVVPAPKPAIKLALGEFAEYVLKGRRAVPKALLEAGFEFKYPAVDAAAKAALA